MERNLKATRIYSLGNYQNLQLTNEINGIPEELLVDNELILNLTKLQLLEMEIQYGYYCAMREKTSKGSSIGEMMTIVEEERSHVIETLFDNKNFNNYIKELTAKG